jgi:hypothetical protein
MKKENVELIEREEVVDGSEITVWYLKRNGKEINVNALFNGHVSECYWLDKNKNYLQVSYNDWDSSEYIAIVSSFGRIQRNGIQEVIEVLDNYDRIIVVMSGNGMGDEAVEYMIKEDDSAWAVIDFSGDFIIPPKFTSISFDEDESVFMAEKSGWSGSYESKFDLNGTEID